MVQFKKFDTITNNNIYDLDGKSFIDVIEDDIKDLESASIRFFNGSRRGRKFW